MNQELLAFLQSQINAGLDNETAMRAAINKGFAYHDIVTAIEAVGGKKKESTGVTDLTGGFQQAPSESVLKSVSGPSSADLESIPEYARQGLGYAMNADVSELTTSLQRRGEIASSQSAFVGQSQEAFAKQVQDTYKYLGYSDDKSKELSAGLFAEAQAQNVDPTELWSRTYHVGYNRKDVEQTSGLVPVEGRERFQETVNVGDAAWSNMISNAYNNGATTSDIFNFTGLRPSKNILTEDASYDLPSFTFDVEDDSDPFQGLKRFWNSSVLRTKISNELSSDHADLTAVAHYQSELMKASDDKDYLGGLGVAGSFVEDYVLDAVLSPVLESVLSLAMGAGTNWMQSVEDLASERGGGDYLDLLNVASMVTLPVGGLAGQVGRSGFTYVQSFALSNSAKVLEVLNELGVDTSDAIALDAAFKDEELIGKAKKRGLDYAVPVAIFDAITAGVAGKLQSALVKRGFTTRTANIAETLLDASLGASGEIAGQVSETGGVYSWGDVALEAIGELAIAAPGRAIETIKRNAKGVHERQYAEFLSSSAVLGEDASVTTNTAYMMNYGEAIALDNKINELKKAIKDKNISRETRASLREELTNLAESKYQLLNKNIEQVRNLSPEQRAQAQQLTSEILSIKSDIKLTEQKSPAQKGLISQLSKKATQLNSVLKGETIQERATTQEAQVQTPAPAATFTMPAAPGEPIVEQVPTPNNIGEAVGSRVTYETPSGEVVEGFLFDEGGGKLVVEEDNGTLHEIGNVQDVGESALTDYKLNTTEQNITKGTNDKTYDINGKTYEYRTDNPEGQITRDAEGRPVSVTLYDKETGKQRTFRGSMANAIAFDMVRPQAQPQVEAQPIAAEPVVPSQPTTEPITAQPIQEPVAPEPAPTAQPVERKDYSGQRTTAVAGRVRAGRGISTKVATAINRMATAFNSAFEKPVQVVFHDTAESIEDATGGPNEAYYDGENTIHLMRNASENAVKEEFAHAAFKNAIAGNEAFRNQLLDSLTQLANDTKNPVLRQFITDRLDVYQRTLTEEGQSNASAAAIAQEEAIVGVLADFTNNLNKLDASIAGKFRRLINEFLYKLGLKEFAIQNDESFINFAEKFSYAYRTGKSLKVNVEATNMANLGARSRKSLSKASGTTQVATTAGSYRKVANIFKKRTTPFSNVLDYGAGLGLGTDAMSDVSGVRVESLEINPERWQGGAPVDYTDSAEITKTYDTIVSLNVVNVVPRDVRDFIVMDIYDKLNAGGIAYVSSRKFKGDIDGAKNFELGTEEKSYIIKRKEGGEFVDVYQKGYDGNELVEYVQSILPTAKVTKGGPWGASTVVIEKPSVSVNKVIPESKATPEMKKGRARLLDFMDLHGLTPKSVKYLGSGVFGNAYLVETATGKKVVKQTTSMNELLINHAMVKNFGGVLPGIAATDSVDFFEMPNEVNEALNSHWVEEFKKKSTNGYIVKEYVDTTKKFGQYTVASADFYRSFQSLFATILPRLAVINNQTEAYNFAFNNGLYVTERQARGQLYRRYQVPIMSQRGLKLIDKVTTLTQEKFNDYFSKANIKTLDQFLNLLGFDVTSDFIKASLGSGGIDIKFNQEVGVIQMAIQPDFFVEIMSGIHDYITSLEQLGLTKPSDIHEGNIGFDTKPSKYGLSPKVLDLDNMDIEPTMTEPWQKNTLSFYDKTRSIFSKLDTMQSAAEIQEFANKITEGLDGPTVLSLLEQESRIPLFYLQPENSPQSKIRIDDFKENAVKYGYNPNKATMFYGFVEDIAKSRQAQQNGRSRLTKEAVAALKEKLVPGQRIGQGVITAANVDQSPGVNGSLQLSLDMARQYPSVYIKNAWFLTQHPMMGSKTDDSLVEKKGQKAGMSPIVSDENMVKADAIYDRFINLAKGNLLFLHDQFDDTVREYAKRWYDGANVIAQDMSSKYAITLEQASGVLASLSPQKDWFQNIALGYSLLDVINNSNDIPFDMDMYEHSARVKRGADKDYDKLKPDAKARKDKAIAIHKQLLDGILGKKYFELTNDLERAVYVRHVDEKFNSRIYNDYNPVGEIVGKSTKEDGTPSKYAWPSYGIIASAIKSASNPSAQSISDALGKQHKIRNFYNNIVNPDAQFGDVTMYTHAVGAAELLIVSGNSVEVAHNLGASASNVFGIAGMYYAFSEAYKLAAAERNILPREMQSITWEAIRLLYKDTFKRDARNRKTNEEIWNKFNNNEITIDETRKQLLELGGGIDRPGWYKLVAEAPVGETQPGVQPGERTDGAAPAGGRARRPKPGDDSPAPGRPASRARKLRGAAARFTAMTSEDALIDEIFANPENYYEPQVIAEIKAGLGLLSKAELIEKMSDGALNGMATSAFTGLKDGDIRILAAVEMLNRHYLSGDTVEYKNQLERLFQYGTGIAQALRQYAELKSSTPAGLEQMIRRMYERQGIELTEEARQTLTDLSMELFEAQQQYRDMSHAVANGSTIDSQIDEDTIAAAEDRLFQATLAMDKFNAMYAQNWGDLLSQIMQGNLLTFKSQVINLFANLINLGKYGTRLIVAAPFDRILSSVRGEGVTVRPSFGAFVHGLSRGAKGFYEAGKIARYGVQPGNAEYRMNLGMRPLTSLMLAMASKDKLGLQFESQRQELDYRAKMLVRGTFGIPAEVMFRLLPFGDRPVYQFVEGNELYMAGRSMGLEGQALRDFLKFPPQEALEQARNRALEVTFQDDSALARGAQAFVRQLETGFGSTNNAMLKVFVRSNLPFVKTPANILNQTLRLSNPIFPALRIASLVVKKGSSKDISEGIGELAISSIIFMTAKSLWEEGLVSAAADQDDARERAMSYSTFPASSINITGLNRWLDGGDPTFQEGDAFQNYMKMGLGGAIMGAQIAGLKMIEKGNRKQESILELGETTPDQGVTDPMQQVGQLFTSSLGTLSNILDQSFLTGVDGLFEVLRNPEPKTFDRYIEGIFKATASIALPNQLSTWYRSEREYLPDYRSNNLTEKLVNVINDRTFGVLSDAPIRVNEWGEDIKQTPEGANPLYYNWFDPINGRIGTTDPVKVEVYNLFMATEDPKVIPNVPSQIVSRRLTVPGSEIMVDITTEEANKLLSLMGTQRTKVMRDVIESDYWKTYDNETKAIILGNIYNSVSNGYVTMDGERFNFDWYNYKLDIIAERLYGQ